VLLLLVAAPVLVSRSGWVFLCALATAGCFVAGALGLEDDVDTTAAYVAGMAGLAGELELVWRDQPTRLAIAAALAGMGLLLAAELRERAKEVVGEPASLRPYQHRLLVRVAPVAAAMALSVLVVLNGVGETPLLGIAGGVAAVAIFATLRRRAPGS